MELKQNYYLSIILVSYMFKCLLPERASQMGSPFLLVETIFLKNVNKTMNV